MYYVNYKRDENNNKYYLRKSSTIESKISFLYYDNILKINFDLFLNGDYNLPQNIFYLYIASNIGNIDQLTLQLVDVENFNYHYKAICNINLDETSFKDKNIFLHNLKFNAYLKVNYSILQDLNINMDNFIQDANKIELESDIYFSNYYPINKLSEYYISQKYINTYKYLDSLPTDFYNWSKTNQINYPDIWINKYDYKNSILNVINPVYYSNLGVGLLSNHVENLKIYINYYVDNTLKKLEINNLYLNENYFDNCLYLGVLTSYNFENQELVQVSHEGINGIYFPEKTHGNINIEFEHNKIKYTDEIPFSYDTNFFSTSNEILFFKIENLKETSGYWNKLGG